MSLSYNRKHLAKIKRQHIGTVYIYPLVSVAGGCGYGQTTQNRPFGGKICCKYFSFGYSEFGRHF